MMKLIEEIDQKKHRELCWRMAFEGFKWDIQIADRCAIDTSCLTLEAREASKLFSWAESLWTELVAIENWIASNRDVLSTLGLPRNLTRQLAPHALGELPRIARFDFHLTETGWKISEVNSDVPGGIIESSLLPEFWPSIPYGCKASGNVGEAYVQSLLPFVKTGSVGLLHAPWYSDDRQQMDYLKKLFRKYGVEAIPVGPDEVDFSNGEVKAFNRPIDLFVRFFPCEWIVKMKSSQNWFSTPVPVSNPFWSITSQVKRLPLIWGRLPFDVPTWKRFLPKTRSPKFSTMWSNQVLKPNLGRVGEGIYLPGISAPRERSRTIRSAMMHPRQWLTQEKFNTLNIGSERRTAYPCLGVYVVSGKACGIYGRISQDGLTNERATDSPVFILEDEI